MATGGRGSGRCGHMASSDRLGPILDIGAIMVVSSASPHGYRDQIVLNRTGVEPACHSVARQSAEQSGDRAYLGCKFSFASEHLVKAVARAHFAAAPAKKEP